MADRTPQAPAAAAFTPASTPVSTPGASRRDFVKTTAAASAAALFASLGNNFAFAQASDTMKVGVIGCGGRGSGAVANHMAAAESLGIKAEVLAIGDAFADRAKTIQNKHPELKEKNVFIGLDAYKQVIDANPDIVILATPPGFRPYHFKAAIEAGKNVFCEKPVATDPTGIRIYLEAAEMSEKKGLTVVAGTQRRHDKPYQDTVKAIHDGAIGDVMHMSIYWNGGGIWYHKREPGQTDLEHQLRNWYHYIWLCGDQICEQHVHNIDVMNWVMGEHPTAAYGRGGRQVRDAIGEVPGQIWDHFATEFEFSSGTRALSFGSHWPKSTDRVAEYVIGTKGTSNPANSYEVKGGEKKTFKEKYKLNNPYDHEHADLFNSIRGTGPKWNQAKEVAHSTMTAIMARMANYSGKRLTWDEAINSKLNLMPPQLAMDMNLPEPTVPMPGDLNKAYPVM